MPSLNLDLNFTEHPKIKRLIARVGYEGVFCLLRLWCHVGNFHKIDGSLKSYTDDEIEQFAGWSGEKGALLQALLDVILIDQDRTIHDWQDHAGHLSAYHTKAKKMAKAKWDAVRTASSNAPSIAPSNISSNASSVQFTSVQSSSEQLINSPATPDFELPTKDEIRQDGIRLGQIAFVRRFKGAGDDAGLLTAMIWNLYEPYNPTPKMFEWIINRKLIPSCNNVRHCFAYARRLGDERGAHVSEARRSIPVED